MFLALALAVFLGSGEVANSSCKFDRATLSQMAPKVFDEDEKLGWRAVAQNPECVGLAADLISEYRASHWAALSPSALHLSYWHEGQLRAAAGQNARAKRLLLAGVDPNGFGDFEDYALGTVAFLDHDLAALKAARARLAAEPEPADFVATAEKYHIKWPLNLDVLDHLIACFDQPYETAYDNCKKR